jgi:hypothetical protein
MTGKTIHIIDVMIREFVRNANVLKQKPLNQTRMNHPGLNMECWFI